MQYTQTTQSLSILPLTTSVSCFLFIIVSALCFINQLFFIHSLLVSEASAHQQGTRNCNIMSEVVHLFAIVLLVLNEGVVHDE